MAYIRTCSRSQCAEAAVATMTYGYREASAVVGPLSPIPQAGALDLCAEHARNVTVPVGWELIRLATEFEPVAPSADDLMALANAIREASEKELPPIAPATRNVKRPIADVTPEPTPQTPNFSVVEGGKED